MIVNNNAQHPQLLGDAILPLSQYVGLKGILNARLVCKDWYQEITSKLAVPLLINSLPKLLKNCKNWDGYYLYNGKAKDIQEAVKMSEEHFLTAYFLKAICAPNDNDIKECSGFSEEIKNIGYKIRAKMDRPNCDLKEIDECYKKFYSFYNWDGICKERRITHMRPPEEITELKDIRGKLLFMADQIATVALNRLYYNKEQLEYSLKQSAKKIVSGITVAIGMPLTILTFPFGAMGAIISFGKGGIFGGGGEKSVVGEILQAPTMLGIKLVDKAEKEVQKSNLSLLTPSKTRKKLIKEIEETFPKAKHTLAINSKN